MCQIVKLCSIVHGAKNMVNIAIVLIPWELISEHVFTFSPFQEGQQAPDSLENAGSLQAGHPGPE